MDIGLDLRRAYDEGFADGVKAERGELFDEIEQELNAALENNFARRREHIMIANHYDNFCWHISGKIDTLRGILDFLAELKKKYGVTDDGEKA